MSSAAVTLGFSAVIDGIETFAHSRSIPGVANGHAHNPQSPSGDQGGLRVRAAEHGHSIEAEVRRILQAAVQDSDRPVEGNLYERVRAQFEPLGGVELDLPPGGPGREPPRFE